MLDPASRTMLVEIDIPNPVQELTPGMFAEVTLDLQRHKNALVIPPAALITESLPRAVFVVSGRGSTEVPVKTGIDDGVWVEVTSGLTGEEDVVVTGKSRLAEGTQVKASPYNLPAGSPASQKY